jgi:hypothetical protein
VNAFTAIALNSTPVRSKMNIEPVMLKAMIPGMGVEGGSGMEVSSASVLRKKTVRLRIVREAATAREDMDKKTLHCARVSMRFKE